MKNQDSVISRLEILRYKLEDEGSMLVQIHVHLL